MPFVSGMQNLNVGRNLVKMIFMLDVHPLQKALTSSRVREVCTEHQLRITEVPGDLNLTFYAVQSVVTEDFQMHCMSAKFVLKILTDDQKR
jgi:hypothetical protein